MRVLREIAEATSPVIMKQLLSGTTRATARTSLIYQFYKLLRSEKVEEESDIVEKLYGKGVGLRDTRYKSLRSRLKKIMLGSLLNEDVLIGSYETYDQAYATGFRQLNLARVLIVRRAYKATAELATYTFKNVKEYEILPLNEGLTDILAGVYLGILHNPRLFKKYHQLHEHYTHALYDYSKVSSSYRIMRSKIYAHKDSPNVIGAMCLDFFQETKEIMEKYLTVPVLQATVRNTQVMGLKLSGHYQEAIDAADEAEEVLGQCKGVSGLVISGLALTQVECILHLRDFEAGKEQVNKTRRLIPKGTINSIKLSEYAVLLGLYTGNYRYAYEEIIQLDRKTLKALLNDQVAEVWFILEAYIRFLVIAGKIKVPEEDTRLRSFRMGKFMNDVAGFAANKQGMNIQILVLQAMFFIVQGELDKFRNRAGALERYCNRYLKDNEKLRHNCFFRLLTEVTKGNFDLDSRRRKIGAIYSRMTSAEAIEISRKTNSEIVPYEALWGILEESIDRHVKSGLLARGRGLRS